MAVGPVGRDRPARAALGPADREHTVGLGKVCAAIADAGHDQIVVFQPKRFGRRMEAEAQGDRLAARRVAGKAFQDFEVPGLAQSLRRRVGRGNGGIERGGIGDGDGARETPHLGQFVVGEGRMLRAAPADDLDFRHGRRHDRSTRLSHDVALGHFVGRLGQHAGHVDGDIAVADHGHALHSAEIGTATEIRMAVQPGHEPPRAPDMGRLFARHAERAVDHHAGRHHHRVVGGLQRRPGDIAADLDAAAEPNVGLGQQLVELAGHRLGALMVRCHSCTHQAERRRQPVDEVDPYREIAAQKPVGGIKARGTGAHDGDVVTHDGPLSI